jgi:nitrous oxidase accessory protein
MSWNTFRKNYWSKYLGYDLDHDNYGDVPFRPVSLSSVVVESIDSSYYLIGSFLFELLDFVERALPELTPEPLKDEQPLLKQWQAERRVGHD